MDPKEMKNEDLEKVTGGMKPQYPDGKDHTRMICSNCGYSGTTSGNHVGETFMCPKCYENTYTGKERV